MEKVTSLEIPGNFRTGIPDGPGRWPHHSRFPKGDPTAKFRLGHPQQGRQIEVGLGYTKNLRFSTSFSEIPIPIPNTEVFQNTDTEYRTDMKKNRRKYRIPIPTPNTDTDPALVYMHFIWLTGGKLLNPECWIKFAIFVLYSKIKQQRTIRLNCFT